MVRSPSSTPPQKILTTVDTGSNALALMSDTCPDDQCYSPYKFHSSKSSTFKKTTAPFKMAYLDQSAYTGVWSSDRVSIGAYHLDNFGLGLVDRTANEPSPSRTLIGFGWPSGTANEPDPWPYQLAQNEWKDPSFGIYIGRLQGNENGKAFSDDYKNGVLSLG